MLFNKVKTLRMLSIQMNKSSDLVLPYTRHYDEHKNHKTLTRLGMISMALQSFEHCLSPGKGRRRWFSCSSTTNYVITNTTDFDSSKLEGY